MSRHTEYDDPGATLDGLLLLANDLASLRVNVPRADAFLERALTMPKSAPPIAPSSIMDATDDELSAYAHAHAVHRLTQTRERDVLVDLTSALCREFAGILRTHADDIVAQLRPDFDAAVSKARELREAGVTESDSPATLIERDPSVIAAWNTFRATEVPTLVMIAEARIDLTRIAGVPPRRPIGSVGPPMGWGAGRPREFGLCFGVPTFELPGEEPWQQWVRLAPSAELVPPSTITQLREQEADGLINPGLIEAVALDRHRQRNENGDRTS